MLKASLKFNNKTPEAIAGIGKNIERAVGLSLLVIERNVKARTPIRTGTLARSIQSKKTSPFDGEVFTGEVKGGKPVDYAIHVEYGTQHMAPRAMFRKGVADSEERINQIFEDELNKKVV